MTTSRSLAVITGVPQACLALDMLVASDKIDADLEVTASCFLKQEGCTVRANDLYQFVQFVKKPYQTALCYQRQTWTVTAKEKKKEYHHERNEMFQENTKCGTKRPNKK